MVKGRGRENFDRVEFKKLTFGAERMAKGWSLMKRLSSGVSPLEEFCVVISKTLRIIAEKAELKE